LDGVKEHSKEIGAVGAFLVGLATLWAAVSTSLATQRSVDMAEAGLVTGRFKNGIENLGAPDASVQAGGIYTLERVATDSPDDAETAFAVILSFVRHNLCAAKFKEDGTPNRPPTIGTRRLGGSASPRTSHRATGAELRGRPGADLTGVDLRGADLESAHLPGAVFHGANLSGADLTGADLEYANLSPLGFIQGANLTGANLTKAIIRCTNFEGTRGFTRNQLRRAGAGWKLRLPPKVDANEKSWIAPAGRSKCKN
jgi:uncharacterized protein YjbI with pentapeptide repeats